MIEDMESKFIFWELKGDGQVEGPGEAKAPMRPLCGKPKAQVLMDCMHRGFRLSETQLGQGHCSKVKVATMLSSRLRVRPDVSGICRSERRQVAVKIVSRRNLPKQVIRELLQGHLDVHRTVPCHLNLVRLVEMFANAARVYVAMELCAEGSLWTAISSAVVEDKRGLPVAHAQSIFRQICSGLCHLHTHNLCHRNMKCENILLGIDGHVKITGFSFSRLMLDPNELLDTACAVDAYTAPEVLRGEKYNGFRVDMWSMGIILYTMVSGRLPFPDKNVVAMGDQGIVDELEFDQDISRDLVELIHTLLQCDPSRRPKAQEVMEGVWLRGVAPHVPLAQPPVWKALHEADSACGTGGA